MKWKKERERRKANEEKRKRNKKRRMRDKEKKKKRRTEKDKDEEKEEIKRIYAIMQTRKRSEYVKDFLSRNDIKQYRKKLLLCIQIHQSFSFSSQAVISNNSLSFSSPLPLPPQPKREKKEKLLIHITHFFFHLTPPLHLAQSLTSSLLINLSTDHHSLANSSFVAHACTNR